MWADNHSRQGWRFFSTLLYRLIAIYKTDWALLTLWVSAADIHASIPPAVVTHTGGNLNHRPLSEQIIPRFYNSVMIVDV